MVRWNRFFLIFDAIDECHVEEALDMVGRIHFDYLPAVAPDVYLRFASPTDACLFKMCHPKTKLTAGTSGILPEVISLETILDALQILSPSTEVGHVMSASIWYRDDVAKNAFNAAVESLSTRFVGPLPVICQS
ncbi:hypothetical protein [Acidiphilium sp. JA12-A1]|uniref:hypothetical protein n=1 Tax=Acidiphilium sp. JA12-A1 TaxID=1464546 RepID=UPI000460F59A|nr:hypothetical protein [Acidiphilium sp. JA12-A1]KDM66638.1 hypothetical protein ACIDI_56c00140 [Acidiphilium sp. JA12-A1]